MGGDSGGRLAAEQLRALLHVVDDVSHPLAAVCASLSDALPPDATFAAGATLAALLQDNLLPVPAQRLVAIYAIYFLITTRYVDSLSRLACCNGLCGSCALQRAFVLAFGATMVALNATETLE
jgi:hypothetical protein